MARNPDLEAILQARYELETCAPDQKTACRTRLDALIEAALAKSAKRDLSPRAFIEITGGGVSRVQAGPQETRARSSFASPLTRHNLVDKEVRAKAAKCAKFFC